MKQTKFLLLFLTFGIILIGVFFFKNRWIPSDDIPTAKVERKSFDVDIKTVGELEAARSTIIASSVRGDLGKIIYIVQDGINVKPNDVLVKMDPTPFEEKLDKLRVQIKEQEVFVTTVEKALEWEKDQAEHENNTALFDVESAQLELEKIIQGDGPLEISKLKSAMQKAWLKYDELNSYSDDLIALQEQGFLNPIELKQAQKKLQEEKEAYEGAQNQYESYINHVYPMLVKKAEANLRRSKMKQEEVQKTGTYQVAKSMALVIQSKQSLKDLNTQLTDGIKELDATEIKAPSPGMVVHREEYRSNQRRKPRVGDVLVKNHPLLDLPDLDSMVVKTKIREVDLHKVAVSKNATIQVDAYPQLIFPGHVSSIGVLALTDLARASEEKYFEVRVTLDKCDGCLRPGMTTRVTIHADHRDNTLTVPLHAIFDDPNQKQNFCFAQTYTGLQKKYISVGACNEQWAEIVSGLDEGDSVYLIDPSIKEE